MTPQELVERALAASTTDGCVVIANDAATTNLRWANNTLTTNGATQTVDVTVIATVTGAEGVQALVPDAASTLGRRMPDLGLLVVRRADLVHVGVVELWLGLEDDFQCVGLGGGVDAFACRPPNRSPG